MGKTGHLTVPRQQPHGYTQCHTQGPVWQDTVQAPLTTSARVGPAPCRCIAPDLKDTSHKVDIVYCDRSRTNKMFPSPDLHVTRTMHWTLYLANLTLRDQTPYRRSEA